MKILFFDTETYARPPEYPSGLYGKIRLLQLKWQGEDVKVYDTMQDPTALDEAKQQLQQADLIVAHNIFYDFNLPEMEQFKFEAKLFDTLLACKYDKPCANKFDLNSCLKRYKIGYKEELGASDWSGELTAEQLEYAKNDVILLEKLYDKVKHISSNPAFKLDMHNYKYAVYYSHNGFPVREDRRLMFIDKYKKEEQEVKAKIPEGLNVNSPKQVTEYLGIPKSDKESLTNLDTEEARNILALRDIQKKLSTLEKKFSFRRVKGLFKPAQAKSGRWTCSKRHNKEPQYQNLQQIDRDLKTVFGYDDNNDYYLVDADYSSLEMFTASAVFNSSKMMRLLIEGKDLHTYTASMVFNKPENEVVKFERQMAKGLNFGTLYGAGVKVVQIFIQTYTGKKMEEDEVAKFRTAWLNTYSDIKKYHNKIGNMINGKHNLLVRTPLGRPICAESYTEAINTPAQGFGAEATKIALWLLHKKIPDIKIVNTVHDSITLEVKGLERAKDVAWILKGCLDESWLKAKKYIKHDNPLLKHLVMDNEATVHKIYEGEVLYSTKDEEF